MELSLNFEQLQLKSEYLHTNSKHTHFHENSENELFVSWDDCVMVLYSLDGLPEASLWNPIEPMIVPISNPIITILTFNSRMYCIDKIGSIYYLKQVQRDSPDLFDSSLSAQVTQQPPSSNYEWKPCYSHKCPCEIFEATCYSDGIAVIIALEEWIIIQMLKITINDNNEPTIVNTCNKQIRSQKPFPFVVTSFISCIWRDWFSSQRAIELFGSNVIDSLDVFIIATEESKVYCTTSNVISKNISLFLNSPQKIVHIQFCDFETKKLVLVSSNGILIIMNCVENIHPSFIYLAVTKTVATFIVHHTVILSDGIHLFQITLDKLFSKIVKQVVTQLKGVISLCRFQSNIIIAMTRLNKVYKLSAKLEVITQEELMVKFDEKSILENIKNLCKSIQSLEEQHENMNKYINAVSIVARQDLVAQFCSFNILIYSGAKAVKLGACQNEYIFAIKLSTDCSWLSFPSSIWQLLVRITDSNNLSSNCALHSFDVDLFDNNHPLMVKHRLLATVAENCTSGLVQCELVCQVQNDSINRCLIIPLNPIKLNSLYFVKAEKREKILVMNPLEDRHKNVFKFPENISLLDCLTVITNRNKHRISKSFYKNIIDNMPKTLYLNYFGKIVSMVLDDKITKTIILECLNQDVLVAVRNGIFSELSNDQPAIIKLSVLADVQKQLCLIEELSIKDRQNKHIVKEIKTNIQNQISNHLPI
ncbi:uncharacterized protein LOC100165824 [Acyrthosiphon pisum]|uniref:Uncharacterized protein n=1 Tax=Acyrthosiphon pisum TaxID=7029 RepID=A0A8R2A773_ACYPI|nr:uncharacterized protein LOC100165824 [Acyrthosiphon pisum]|eukprot:XP_001948571.1 PREDICTED: uncharacterized protein LOC100165824 [Acyrthosiphon pisum]